MPRSPVPQRTSLVVLGLLVLLAVLGWAMYLSVKAGYDAQQARFNQERTELTGRVADLEGTLATERSTSSGRIAGLEDTLAGERAAAGDLAALTGRIEQAKADLNRRMTALGERERDRAAAEAALGETRSQLTALTEQRAGATGRLNQRLMVLGQREVDLASAGRALDHARAERDRLQAEIAGLEQTFANRNGTLGAVDVKLAALLRERAKATAALERTQGALAGTQTTLTEVEAKLDKALLAQDVAELAASRTALRQEVADLNAELDHKQPLFHQSVSVNRQLLGLDERLRSLSIERDKLTVQLQALVAELARAREGHAARAIGAPEDLVKLTGE